MKKIQTLKMQNKVDTDVMDAVMGLNDNEQEKGGIIKNKCN